MKFMTYRTAAGIRMGEWDGHAGLVFPLSNAHGEPLDDLVAYITGSAGPRESLVRGAHGLSPDDVDVLAPIPVPRRNMFCVGKNYKAHAREFSQSGYDAGHGSGENAIPQNPIVFSKTPECVIGTGQPIWAATGVTDSLDYEAELAVIIGKEGRGIERRSAMEHVWGYTIINDVTARDWQRRHKQWFLGKSFDTFGPMGPVAVERDDIDGSALELRCWVNGELRQHANTRDLIFDIPRLIETISAGITLLPGDIIATGTPEGVGIGRDPPVFLKPGDTVRIDIEGIGSLVNPVR
jgi:2-keto-4-pentenoate hydratase/2-oxohepta-3-ene-1,7-dioic acid hydratase in catechol pathway